MPDIPKTLNTRSTIGTVTLKEIIPLLPCFYDLRLQCVAEITKITVTMLKRLRDKNNGVKNWPFRTVVAGFHSQINWRNIRLIRGQAIQNASDDMKHILFKAEVRAMQTRAKYLAKEIQESIEAEIPFPPIPHHIMITVRKKDYTPVTVVISSTAAEDVPDPQIVSIQTNNVPRILRPLYFMSPDDVHLCLHHMIDIPIINVSAIMGVSTQTLTDFRKHAGLLDWPYNKIRKGVYSESQKEIALRREALLMATRPDSAKFSVLYQAMVKSLEIQASAGYETDSDTSYPPPPVSSPVIHCETSAKLDDIRDWFGILIESPPPQPKAEPWVTEALAEANINDDPFWDVERLNPITPGTRAYWDSLIDIDP